MSERDLGLELFLTEDIPGIGGKLRRTPEDFEVDETSILPPEDPEGRFVIAKVWHRNWEANRLVRRLSTNLRVGRAKIGFAGTKDGRSVATQLMSFDAPIESVQALSIPDVVVSDAYRAKRAISIGDLIGNRFAVRVTDLRRDVDVARTCADVRQRLDATGGFPNFFGVQRFGSVRPITHLVGKDLIRGDFEGAVMRYVANPMDDEDSDANDARRALQESRDFERALKEFPQKLTFERTMITCLKDRPGDYLGALRTLPKNLLMMFVHAYQSYLFNKILSERIRAGMSLREPEVGDLVLPLSKTNVPDHDYPIPVTEGNLNKARKSTLDGKAFVSGLIFGMESQFADGRMGEIERRVVGAEEIDKMDFQIVGLREASSKGIRRELLAQFKDLTIDFDGEVATFRFVLNKGCYATSFMREFMKAEMSRY